jgi:hypothetical protein
MRDWQEPPDVRAEGVDVKYAVDRAKCNGHGQCYTFAPSVYMADSDGYNPASGTMVVPLAAL